jgi:beta-glucosidase
MTRWRRCALVVLAAVAAGCATPTAPPARRDFASWPVPAPVRPADPALEAQVAQWLAGMSLEQKIGQMTQAEIRSITPDEVRRYFIGSVLNGGGSVPGGRKTASAADWLALAERFHDASMAVASPVKVPLIWGTDAVHGHNNVFGATVFPHNIGLGAAHEPELAGRLAAATARAVRASGIRWVFAPTVAVARDPRWGRAYESWSEDPAVVRAYAQAHVAGLQGQLQDDDKVMATAKHFIGDGGTDQGRDQGITRASIDELRDVHAQGYYGALAADVQTVWVSYNSWSPLAEGSDPGKLHGSRTMLTDLLKGRLGFDGLVVSDWNGINQVPGCSNASCPQAINAGIDMIMVPDDWKAFIANTLAQVKSGAIPLARIDDAVSRILRVKLRAGLVGQRPSTGAHAGRTASTQARELAREAVRKSLVLLKNRGGVLPLARSSRVLVVGAAADSIQQQTGGWTLSWQGTGNSNADFPDGDSILAGLVQALGANQVVYSPTALGMDVKSFDAVIAVVGETPYAEGNGDIPPSGTLQHTSRQPQDLALLKAVAGRGRPVVTVLLSGRPLFVNDLLNRSDAFVAAWLPGSEGAGIADLLLRKADGGIDHDFQGRLSFSWPKAACQAPLFAGMPGYAPLFPLGFGLRYGPAAPSPADAALDESHPDGGCGASRVLTLFQQSAVPPYALHLGSPAGRWPEAALARDPLTVHQRPDATVSTVQINTQQDAQRVAWTGPARLFVWSPSSAALSTYRNAALVFDLRVVRAPDAAVTLGMGCGDRCRGALDVTRLLRALPLETRRTLKLPLACFAAAGVDLSRVDQPFILSTSAAFTADVAHLRIVAGAARDTDAIACAELPTNPPP